MKDSQWHKPKHDCEEVTYQSLWILFINVEEDQPLWIFTIGEEDQPLWIFTNGEEDQSLCIFIQSPALVSLPPGLINSQRFLNYLWKERTWQLNDMRVFLGEGEPIALC